MVTLESEWSIDIAGSRWVRHDLPSHYEEMAEAWCTLSLMARTNEREVQFCVLGVGVAAVPMRWSESVCSMSEVLHGDLAGLVLGSTSNADSPVRS